MSIFDLFGDCFDTVDEFLFGKHSKPLIATKDKLNKLYCDYHIKTVEFQIGRKLADDEKKEIMRQISK